MPDSDALTQKLDVTLAHINKKLDDATGERKSTQLWMTLFTAFITTAVGFAAWFAQNRIQQHIDVRSQELETTLALKQEVYGRKLDRYESVHQQMAALANALSQVQADSTQKKNADDAIHQLYVTYTTDSLYLSNDVIADLKVLVNVSGDLPSMVSAGGAAPPPIDSMQPLDDQIAKIEDQMKSDLSLVQLGQISPPKSQDSH